MSGKLVFVTLTIWSTFLKHDRHQLLACDFFTVKTLRLQTLYVLFFIEIETRRLTIAGDTDHPTTQQARRFIRELPQSNPIIELLLRDRDAKYTRTFDAVFQSEGVRVIRTPIRTPQTNGFAEHWIRSV